MRHLILILGDQLSFKNPALEGFDPQRDTIVMIEAASEARAVWSHKARIALFLSAMRHFAAEIRERGWPCIYVALEATGNQCDASGDFGQHLSRVIDQHAPVAVRVAEPGELSMLEQLQSICGQRGIELLCIDDTHFLCSQTEFREWAAGRKELRMEFFYRVMRKKYDVLMHGAAPEGGAWNYDVENRSAWPKRGKAAGPGEIATPARFSPDVITGEVMALVEKVFPDHPGSLDYFIWPVTRDQALEALDRFIEHRLTQFGELQDAMWTDTPFGWHALLSSSLNLHLLDPREVVAAAEQAYREGRAPLAGVEGFIRQILGWREFIRGMYWLDMPRMKTANHYGHRGVLPKWYWTADTGMACMRDCVGQILRYGYAHHIQRLMVTGNFALLAELEPQEVCNWYLAMYVDAVEWVELPNTAGMALHACGNRFTSKPYISSGAYIKRQSNYCESCRYDPGVRIGAQACPFTTLYWNFLHKNRKELAANPRTVLMTKNLDRLSARERDEIVHEAQRMLNNLDRL